MESRTKAAAGKALHGKNPSATSTAAVRCVGFAIVMCLLGCSKEYVKRYDYCVVDFVTEKKVGDVPYRWDATCVDGPVVSFSRIVQKGDGIYYTPYTEDNDTTTLHGYIRSIQEVVP